MQLKSFIAGCFGIVGFVASLLAGLYVNNSTSGILMRALLALVACYAVGYVIGLVAQFVAREHSQRIAQKVAEMDASAEAHEKAELERITNSAVAVSPPSPAT